LLPLISGVCSVAGTFEITSIPTKAASTNTTSREIDIGRLVRR
jgi:hypothetical protein